MPKRSNDFQKLVYLVRLNLAEGARVTESKMLTDRYNVFVIEEEKLPGGGR